MAKTIKERFTEAMVFLAVGLPVTIGMCVIVLAFMATVFILLLLSVLLLSSPFLSGTGLAAANLTEGIPHSATLFFGTGFTFLTVIGFMFLISLMKAVYRFVRDMVNTMTGRRT